MSLLPLDVHHGIKCQLSLNHHHDSYQFFFFGGFLFLDWNHPYVVVEFKTSYYEPNFHEFQAE